MLPLKAVKTFLKGEDGGGGLNFKSSKYKTDFCKKKIVQYLWKVILKSFSGFMENKLHFIPLLYIPVFRVLGVVNRQN